jgi:hypothetical protein
VKIKCADCGCFPENCKQNMSGQKCTNCVLETCCCKKD